MENPEDLTVQDNSHSHLLADVSTSNEPGCDLKQKLSKTQLYKTLPALVFGYAIRAPFKVKRKIIKAMNSILLYAADNVLELVAFPKIGMLMSPYLHPIVIAR